MIRMQKISPFLWFDDQAEKAATFYVSVFKNSKINKVSRGSNGNQRSGAPADDPWDSDAPTGAGDPPPF